MQKNIYISNIDTPLGYHIAQFFREDHISVDSPTRIVGSSLTQQPISGVHSLINFQKYPNLACRAVLDCDLIILDLHSPSHEAQVIIRFLQHVIDKQSKKLRIIGISSLLTWQGMRGFQLEHDSHDKEAMMNNILDQHTWKSIDLKDSDYQKRVPSNMTLKCYQLENLLLSLNQKQNIKASVLAIGVLYGKENTCIQSQIFTALSNEPLTIWGNGINQIPLVHIQTFLESIQILIEKDNQYVVLRDKATFSQQKVKELISKAAGSKIPPVSKDPLFLTYQQFLWTFGKKIQCSKIFEKIEQKKNFQQYCQKALMSDLCQYTQWTPCQAVLFIDEFDGQTVEVTMNQLMNNIQIINQQEIQHLNQEQVAKNIPIETQPVNKKPNKLSKNSLVQQQVEQTIVYYKEILERLLRPRKYHNFILFCTTKMKQYLIQGGFYDKLIEITKQSKETQQKRCVTLNSKEFYDLLRIQQTKQQKSPQVGETIKKNDACPVYRSQTQGKKDETLILTTQYLLDNVLSAVSEARFHMKSNGHQNLTTLIDELKHIWERGNYRPCIDKQKKENYFGKTCK